ncbi:hypothetical protein SBBP1_220012 [Burkholderiales bacterium]|nr:hypothetical protein SBBP1_220012 [Burkholderiales bacterium]
MEPATESESQPDAYSGAIVDGYVWGRRAWDAKGHFFAMMEAVQILAAPGFQPARTLYLAFGHDAEMGRRDGTRAIAALLKSRGVCIRTLHSMRGSR